MNDLNRAVCYIKCKIKESLILWTVFILIFGSLHLVFKLHLVAKQNLKIISDDFYDYQQAVRTLSEVLHMSLIGLMVISMIVVSMIVFFRTHHRFREIGVYLAIGKTKGQIIIQQFLELVLLLVIALPVPVIVNQMVAPQLGKKLVSDALNVAMSDMPLNLSDALKARQQQILNSIVGLDACADIMSLIEVSAMMLVSIGLSVMIGSYTIMRLSPKQILSRID